MRNTPEPSGIKIPPVILQRDAHVLHSLFKQIKPFLTLTPADYFPYAGHKDIHGRNGPAVIVQSHIERFYFFGIIVNNYRLFEIFLRKIALMFRLKVSPVVNLILKCLF